ncbi:MAG: AsmA family protein [Betaproteobacteria bacterium]|nr:AsmA family protein [Betaproteobacteria bacterium]
MKILKYALLAAGGAALLLGSVLAYVAATFNPNDYKPQIVQAVKEQTRRTLKLDGDIKLSIFPGIGAKVARASLSERAGEKEFAAVEEARVALKLLPLLSKQAVVDAIEVKGLRVNLIRFKDGRTNADDLAGAPDKTAPAPKEAEFKIDIDHVLIEDAALAFADQASGAKYALSKLNLRTGRIAPGVPTSVELSAMVRADKPRLDLQTAFKARLTFDPGKQRYAIEGLDLDARGDAPGIKGLVATARGDVDVRAATKELSVSKLVVSASGRQAGGDLKVKLDAPRLSLTKDKVSGDRITLDAALAEAKSKLVARLDIPGIEGDAKAFRSGQLTANLELQQQGSAVKVKLTSPVTGSVEAGRIELPKLTAGINVNNPKLPKNPMDATITGAAVVDFARQNASLNFATKLDDSSISGKVGLARFAPPSYTFDVNVDQLDADRYLPTGGAKAAAGSKPAPGAEGKAGEQPLDFSALKGLNASGSVRIGALKVANVKASNVRVVAKAAGGRLDVNPINAGLYQGTLNGALSVQAAATPVIGVRQTLAGVQVGPLLKDAADFDMLEGRGNVSLDVTGQGATVAALKKALNGNAAIKLADGAIKGIDVAGTLRDVKSKLGALKGQRTQAANQAEKTDFSELSGTFQIRNGVARNHDLQGKSPALRLAGEGEIDIGQELLNYLIKASVVATSRGQGGRDLADLGGITVPVRVTGSFARPSYNIDFGGVAADLARQQLEKGLKGQLERRLGGAAQPAAPAAGGAAAKEAPQPGGGLRDALKGLFGR